MENKKQTAVDWVYRKLLDIETGENGKVEIKMGFDEFKDLFMNGEEMHKHQILDAYVQGNRFKVDTAQSTPEGIEPEVMGAVDYYDNVYNK